MQALGLVVLAERLRPNAADTVAFFADQQVDLKVLSGDAPATVGAIAHDAGVPGSAPALDGEALPSEPEALRKAVLAAPAVGRISPDGKRAVVDALTDAGRYVAMVGDGVNDVPALKEARLAIAQGSGTQMARTVADLVLVRNDFGVVPGMVAEGRQILRNIQRVAQLFVTKSVFVAVVGLAVAIPTATFPLLPRQFTIASTVTIGIPAFVLALAPSSARGESKGSVKSVARFAVPSGIAIGIGIITGYLLAHYVYDLDIAHARTVATGIVVICGLAVVMRLETQGRQRRSYAVGGLCLAMALLFGLALAVPFLRDFYELSKPKATPSPPGPSGPRWESAACSPHCACSAPDRQQLRTTSTGGRNESSLRPVRTPLPEPRDLSGAAGLCRAKDRPRVPGSSLVRAAGICRMRSGSAHFHT